VKTIVVFDMPEDAEELKEYMEGPRWQHAMSELDGWLRLQTKHAEPSETTTALTRVRDMLFQVVDNHDLTL